MVVLAQQHNGVRSQNPSELMEAHVWQREICHLDQPDLIERAYLEFQRCLQVLPCGTYSSAMVAELVQLCQPSHFFLSHFHPQDDDVLTIDTDSVGLLSPRDIFQSCCSMCLARFPVACRVDSIEYLHHKL